MEFKYPQIRIERSWLLEDAARAVARQSMPDFEKREKLFTDEEIENRILAYRVAWAKYEGKMLRNMCDVLGLEFLHNIIDVNVVSYWGTAMAHPLIISARIVPDRFPHTLTHELLHVLLGDNTQVAATQVILKKMTPPEMSQVTRNHVLVHATHKFLLLDVLGYYNHFEHEVKRCNDAPDYKASWDFVKQFGYLNLIRQFRELANLGPCPHK